MNLLINLIPIKKGGGQQVASNFINQLTQEKQIKLTFIATKGTYIADLLESKGVSLITIKGGNVSRFYFQYFKLGKVVKEFNIDVIYTMFGPGLHVGNILSITGTAYSNIYFPEIDFWNKYSFFQKIKLKLIDLYRLKTTLKSDAIIFENAAMQERAHKLYNYPLEHTKLILPSVSDYKTVNDKEFNNILQKIDSKKFNIVLLTGWHKNKNIEILPNVLYELKKQSHTSTSFIITVSGNHPNALKLVAKAQELGVSENLIFINSVAPHNIPLLFRHIDGVGLFSLLESFSNNIIEAWYFNKPLFISDEEWSRSICKDAAVYVDRSNAKDIADKIISYRKDKNYQQILENEIKEILKTYPSPKEKVELQLEFIKSIYNERSN